MAFAPGHPKAGGRKKGTPNKRTRELEAILEEEDFCPVRALIKIHEAAWKEYQRSDEIYDAIQERRDDAGIQTPLTDTAPQYLAIAEKAASDLMPYRYPKLASIEATGKNGGPLNLTALVQKVTEGFEPKEEGDADASPGDQS